MTRGTPSCNHGLPAERIPITKSYPFELHYVKALFLARQYRECIRRCEEALLKGGDEMETAHKIFLNFYTAFSRESLARLMHVYSVSRLPECDAAESAYLKALNISQDGKPLPEIKYYLPRRGAQRVPVQHECTKSTTPGILVTENILDSTFKDFSDDEEERASRLSFSWQETSTCTEDKENEERSGLTSSHSSDEMSANHKTYQRTSPPVGPSLFPNSLFETPSRLSRSSSQAEVTKLSMYHSWISKAPYSAGAVYNHNKCGTYFSKSQDLQVTPETPLYPDTSSKTYISPIHPPQKATYNSHLTAMSLQLQTHLTHIRTLQQETITAQFQRVQRRTQSLLSVPTTNPKPTLPHSRSFWSFTDPVVEMQEKNERIEDGRARGWVFERFDEERYIRLAGEVLAELGVKSCEMDSW